MGFYDAFFGSDQSLYTAYSIIAAIIAICLTILLTATDVPIGNRILIVLFVIITLIPSIFLTLFELTCIVTGGTEPNRWWCHAFAWILAAFIIIYCVVVVVVSLVSLFNYNNAIHSVNNEEQKYKISNKESDNYAKEMIHADEEHVKEIEKFKNSEGFYDGPVELPDISSIIAQSKKNNEIAQNYNNNQEEVNNIPNNNPTNKVATFVSGPKSEHFYDNITINSDKPVIVASLDSVMRQQQERQQGQGPPPQQGPPQQGPQQVPQQGPQQVSRFENQTPSLIPSPTTYSSSSSNVSTPPLSTSTKGKISGFANLNEGADDSIIDDLYAAWK